MPITTSALNARQFQASSCIPYSGLVLVQLLLSFLLIGTITAQTYFPPVDGSEEWETLTPESLGYCPERIDSLYDYLEATNTKAFILLKDGRIVLEQYFNGHSVDQNWYWASAGKGLTAFLVGMAEADGDLDLNAPTSDYLGPGWTALSPDQEEEITVWHQLTMTTGLDDGVPDSGCTLDSCLQFLAAPATRWAYHNAPYTLLNEVVEGATGYNLNQYANQNLRPVIGMNGAYIRQGYNYVNWSTPRSMARFGLLIQNGGAWADGQSLVDSTYFADMLRPSQSINPSYGYLWWLSGQEFYQLPGTQLTFPGSMFLNTPEEAVAALGANGQFLNVVPSEGLVWLRMGEDPGALGGPVPFLLNDSIWSYLNDLECMPSAAAEPLDVQEAPGYFVSPNPVAAAEVTLSAKGATGPITYRIYTLTGNTAVTSGACPDLPCRISTADFPAGLLNVLIRDERGQMSQTRLLYLPR